jgi:tRNA(Ile)-lysidine synthase
MLKQVLRFNKKYNLFSMGNRILLACSGGPDSLCMVHIFLRLAVKFDLKLFVAHVEHGIRGASSIDDADFVKDFCHNHNVPFYLCNVDACGYAQQRKISLELAARELRYRFLYNMSKKLNCDSIAVAHNRRDQVETVLMHFVRGAGAPGLSGMQPKSNGIIRPLLNCSRTAIERYCQNHELLPRHDITNEELVYTRNNVRLKLLPLLHEYNPNIEMSVVRSAALIRDMNDFVVEYATKVYEQCTINQTDRISINITTLKQQHIAIQREIVRMAVTRLHTGLKDIESVHIEAALSLIEQARTGSQINLPHGVIIKVEYDKLIVTSVVVINVQETSPLKLSIPGELNLAGGENRIIAEKTFFNKVAVGRNECYVDIGKLQVPLFVRFRKNGDFFYPKGMNGRKKLKDLFIDNKIPREKRDKIPLVCDAGGIVWVAGIQQDNRYIPTAATVDLVKLTII